MADISKCFGNGCKMKEICYRFTSPGNDLYQSYSMFDMQLKENDTHCEDFWPDEQIKDANGTDE